MGIASPPTVSGGSPRAPCQVGGPARTEENRVMPTVREILARKGSHVFTIGTGASVMEAACLMNEHKIGSLVVIEQGAVVGVFTERDILQRVVGERRDP